MNGVKYTESDTWEELRPVLHQKESLRRSELHIVLGLNDKSYTTAGIIPRVTHHGIANNSFYFDQKFNRTYSHTCAV